MKIRLGEMKEVLEGFGVLASKDLPVKRAYWVGKTLKKLVSEFKDAEETRQKLCLKHCRMGDDGKPVMKKDPEVPKGSKFDIPDMETFQKELGELWDVEIEIEFDPLLTVDALEGIQIDGLTLMKLERFIKPD